MKSYLSLLIVFTAISPVYSQGVVTFANSVLQPPPDRLVRSPDGYGLLGSDWCAQLYFGSDETSLRSVAALPVTFFSPGFFLPGTWHSVQRTLDGFSTGEIVTLQVRAWDCALFADYDSAAAAGGIYGGSIPFTYVVPAFDAPPQSFYMNNFVGFTLVPEPGTVALFALGGVLVFASLRCRR